jgi:hypothetical protein
MPTTDERLRQWWDSLSADQRARLLDADLRQPLSDDLVDVVKRAKLFGAAIQTWWEQSLEDATWHARSAVRRFVDARRYEQ